MLLDRGCSDAVAQGDDLVAVFVAAAHRRLDTTVGEETAEHDRLDSLAAQDEVKVGAGESVQPPLSLDEDVALFRSHLVGDRPAPAAFDESRTVDDTLEDPVGVCADLVVARGEGDRGMHDRCPGSPRRLDHPLGVREHVGLVHDGFYSAVERTAFGDEVVLVLDEYDSRRARVDRHEVAPLLCGAAPDKRTLWCGWLT